MSYFRYLAPLQAVVFGFAKGWFYTAFAHQVGPELLGVVMVVFGTVNGVASFGFGYLYDRASSKKVLFYISSVLVLVNCGIAFYLQDLIASDVETEATPLAVTLFFVVGAVFGMSFAAMETGSTAIVATLLSSNPKDVASAYGCRYFIESIIMAIVSAFSLRVDNQHQLLALAVCTVVIGLIPVVLWPLDVAQAK